MADSNPLIPKQLAASWTPPEDTGDWKTREIVKKNLQTKFEKLGNILAIPHDVYEGKVDPLSDEGFARTMELAQMLGPGPLVSKGAGSAARAAMGFSSKLPEGKTLPIPDHPIFNSAAFEHNYTQDKLNTAWIINGKLNDLENPEHLASIVAHSDANPSIYLKILEEYPKIMEELGYEPETVGAAIKHLQAVKPLPSALPITPQGQAILDKVSEENLPQAYKLYEHMYKTGETDPVEAAFKVTAPNETSLDQISKVFNTAKEMKYGDDPLAKLSSFIKETKGNQPVADFAKPPAKYITPWPVNNFDSTIGSLLDQHVQPLASWQELQANRLFQSIPDEVKQRAAAAGFNPNLPLYKGMNQKLVEPPKGMGTGGVFDIGPSFLEKQPETNALWDPITKPHERAIFASDNPKIASQYADSPSGSHVLPLFARSQSPYVVDWPKINGGNEYSGKTMSKLIDHVRAKNGDAVVIHNIGDVGGMQTQYAFMHPELLRSQNAEFNPAKIGDNNLLAARGLPMSLMVTPVDHDPFEEEK